jgi:hypothetical protein
MIARPQKYEQVSVKGGLPVDDGQIDQKAKVLT